MRLSGYGVGIEVAGQSLRADVFLENETLTEGGVVTRMGLENLEGSLGDGSNEFVSLTGSGSLIVTSEGVAGQLEAAVSLSAGLDFGVTSDRFIVEVNTTQQAVNETFEVSGKTFNLNLEAGPYFRVTALEAILTIAGQSLSANVSF